MLSSSCRDNTIHNRRTLISTSGQDLVGLVKNEILDFYIENPSKTRVSVRWVGLGVWGGCWVLGADRKLTLTSPCGSGSLEFYSTGLQAAATLYTKLTIRAASYGLYTATLPIMGFCGITLQYQGI